MRSFAKATVGAIVGFLAFSQVAQAQSKVTVAQALIRRYSRATADLPLKEQKAAVAEFERRLKMTPAKDRFYAKAWYDLGTDLWRLGAFERAAAAFAVVVDQPPASLELGFRFLRAAAASQRAMVLGDMKAPLARRLSAWKQFEGMIDPNSEDAPRSRMMAKGAVIEALTDANAPERLREAMVEVKRYLAQGHEGRLTLGTEKAGFTGEKDWQASARTFLRNASFVAADLREVEIAEGAYKLYLDEFGHGKDEIAFAHGIQRALKGTLESKDFDQLLKTYDTPGAPRAAILNAALEVSLFANDCARITALADELLSMAAEPRNEEDPAQYRSLAESAKAGCGKSHHHKIAPRSTESRSMGDAALIGLMCLGCAYGFRPLIKRRKPAA